MPPLYAGDPAWTLDSEDKRAAAQAIYRRVGGANMQAVPHLTYTILEIDRDYVAREMLPALAEEHFTRISGADFQIAVVSRRPEARVIYHSSDAFNPARRPT